MAPTSSPTALCTLRLATAGDFDAYMDAFEAVAAEGRWMGAEAPLDREARRPAFDRAVAGDAAVLFLADASGATPSAPGSSGDGASDGARQDGGGILGGAYSAVSGGIVDLGMFVASGHRGAGVGSALLEAVIDWARRQGAHKISLAAWPTNHPAMGLYARYGFRVEGTGRRHYRRRSGALWDATFMGLVLDEQTPGGPGRSPVRPSIVLPAGGLRAREAGARSGVEGTGGPATAGRPNAEEADGLRVAAKGVVLRPWHRADIPALVALLDDPDIRQWLDRIPQPYTPADAEEYIAGTRIGLTAGTQVPLAIVVDGALAGSIDLRLDAVDSANGETGYWVGAPVRRRGVATAALERLCEFGFDTLGLRRIELNAAAGNTASRRVAEKAGFEAEGTRRAFRSIHGTPTDFVLYSRLAPLTEGAPTP